MNKKVFLIILAFLIISQVIRTEVLALESRDLVRTKDSPALYLIQNGQKRVFPHSSVYHSWGLPADYSTVKVVSDLSNYQQGEPVPFRDGSLFRGTTISLYGKTASAVFYVENGKLRPIKSSEIYQKLFNDPKWKKVVWVPDDLLDKFAYPITEMIESADTHPDGSLVRYKGAAGIYLIENSKKRPITSNQIIQDNRLNLEEVIEIELDETYETGPAVQSDEEKLTLNIPNAVKNATFVKTYRFYDFNHSRGVWPTEDNNYLLAGWTIIGRQPDAFISKINQQGNQIWTKLVGSWVHYSGPMGTGPANDVGYLAAQLKDGSYLLVGQTNGYVGDAEAAIFETAVDIFLSKFDKQGNHLWTQTVGDLAGDTPVSIWPTDDKGFLLYGTLGELGAGAEYVGDEDHYFFLAKFSQDGKKEWSKKTNLNIGGTMGEEEQVNFFAEREDDGSLVLVGTVPFDEILKGEDEEIGSRMPTVVKLDKNFNLTWSKSIEAIPTEYLIAKPADNELGYTESYMKARWAAGNFYSVQKTPDNGYLVLGFLLPFTKGYANYDATYKTITGTPLLAIKMDKDGRFQWAKTLTTGLYSFDNEFRIAKTKDNDFIIMRNFMSGGKEFGGELYDIYMKKSEEVAKLYPVDYKPGDEEKNPILKKAMEERDKAFSNWASATTRHISLLKVDPEFNVKWFKTIGPEVKPIAGGAGAPYEFTGSDIRIGNDGGIVIAGTYGTDVVCFVSFGEKFYCYDALLIKLDANGELIDNSAGLVSARTSISQEDLSQYIVLRDLKPKIIDYELGVKRQGRRKHEPDVWSKKARAITTLSPFKEKAVVLRKEGPISSITTPQSAPRTKTWGEINYEATETVELVNEKSRQVHNELWPILNQLFNNQVKLRDNFGGISLDYTFGRLVTRDDVIAVQKELEKIGYTTDTSEGGQLIVMKVGRTLSMIFSVKSRRQGTLNLTF